MLSVTHYFALEQAGGPRQPSFLRPFQRYLRASLNSQPAAFRRRDVRLQSRSLRFQHRDEYHQAPCTNRPHRRDIPQ